MQIECAINEAVRTETKRRMCLLVSLLSVMEWLTKVEVETPAEVGMGSKGVKKSRGRRFYRTDLSPLC